MAILFVAMMFAILVGIHVVLAAIAGTAVQSAADAGVAAAQAAGPGTMECDGDATTEETARQCEGTVGVRLAMAAARNSVGEARPPAVIVEPERGMVTVHVFGITPSPLFGALEFTAHACAPLDDNSPSELTSTDAWRC